MALYSPFSNHSRTVSRPRGQLPCSRQPPSAIPWNHTRLKVFGGRHLVEGRLALPWPGSRQLIGGFQGTLGNGRAKGPAILLPGKLAYYRLCERRCDQGRVLLPCVILIVIAVVACATDDEVSFAFFMSGIGNSGPFHFNCSGACIAKFIAFDFILEQSVRRGNKAEDNSGLAWPSVRINRVFDLYARSCSVEEAIFCFSGACPGLSPIGHEKLDGVFPCTEALYLCHD
jgi:hypothetical protein